MKKLLYLPLLILIVNCSRFGQDPAEIVEPLPSYMKEVFAENKDCIPQPSFYLNVGEKTYYDPINSYDNYTDQSFVNFDGNHSIFYINDDGFYDLFPNFPAKNSSVIVNNENYSINEIYPRLQVTSNLPKSYLNNLKIGSYVLNNDDYTKHTLGFKVELAVNCSLNENPNYSYCAFYKIDLKKPHQLKIDCIDKSDPANVKVSGTFEGTFISNLSEDPNVNMAESKFIKGNFSYIFR